MSQSFLPNSQANNAIDGMFPVANRVRTCTAVASGSPTAGGVLTFGDVAGICIGMVLTGGSVTGTCVVIAVNQATNQVTTAAGAGGSFGTVAYTFALSYWVALFVNPGPGTAGTQANEVAPGGNAYARQSATLGAASAGVEATTNAQNWVNMPNVTVTSFGFFAGSTLGQNTGANQYLGGGNLQSSLTVPAAATVAAASGNLTVAVNS